MSIERIERLNAAIARGQVGAGSMSFANSLLQQYRRFARLSANQWSWVDRLAAGERSEDQRAAPVRPVVADVGAIYDWMTATGLATPVLRFPTIRLSLPGPNSRYAGQRVVFVKSARGVYLGRWEGTTFYRAAACTDTAGVIVSLNEVAANPQQAAVAYARLTSTCCFCGTGLTDERSVRHGYGPICADRYNLPWDAPRTGSTVRGPRLAAPRTSAAASAMASMQASEEAAMMAEAAAIQAAERAEQQRADLHSIAQEGVVLDAEDRRFL